MIKLVILDVDGILTDGKKYYDAQGKVIFKNFCDKDWTAIKRFKAIGVEVILLTGDPWNKWIEKNRNIPVLVNRSGGKHEDKSKYLNEIMSRYSLDLSNIVYMGDDLFDIGIMKKIKYSYCPEDSPKIVKEFAEVIYSKGGENCIVKLFDKLIEKKLIPNLDFDKHMEEVYKLDIKEKF